MSNPLRTHVKNFLLYKFWEIGPSFINKYTVSVSIYERLAGVTSKLAQNEYTGSATKYYASIPLRVLFVPLDRAYVVLITVLMSCISHRAFPREEGSN